MQRQQLQNENYKHGEQKQDEEYAKTQKSWQQSSERRTELRRKVYVCCRSLLCLVLLTATSTRPALDKVYVRSPLLPLLRTAQWA